MTLKLQIYSKVINQLSGLCFDLYDLCWSFLVFLTSLAFQKANGLQKFEF